MQRKPVKSSNVKSVGYDPSSQTLQVEYNSGGIWDYSGIDPSHAAHLQGVPSIGGYIAKHIKPHYKATKVTG